MPAVAFHFNVPDRMAYACRLLRKAYRQGAKVVVTGPSRPLHELDRMLWTFEPLEFIPHWRGESIEQLPQNMADTPVLLVSQPEAGKGPSAYSVVVNLGDEVVQGAEVFERVIEIVGQEADDRQRARDRWRAYAARDWPIERHEFK